MHGVAGERGGFSPLLPGAVESAAGQPVRRHPTELARKPFYQKHLKATQVQFDERWP